MTLLFSDHCEKKKNDRFIARKDTYTGLRLI